MHCLEPSLACVCDTVAKDKYAKSEVAFSMYIKTRVLRLYTHTHTLNHLSLLDFHVLFSYIPQKIVNFLREKEQLFD